MKTFIHLLLFGISSISLLAIQPSIKITQYDGTSKSVNISDINEIVIQNHNNNNVLEIFNFKKQVFYYPIEIIINIKFDANQTQMTINYTNTTKVFNLSEIDSIIIIKDIYQPLTIGKQVWMLKNLNVDTYKNGDTIPEVRDSTAWLSLITGAWCFYNNDSAMGAIYGKLYNWFAVKDPRGLAPAGWHVATDAEWTELETCLGDSLVAGGKLKSTGTIEDGDGLWYAPNRGATNESGFSGLPGGYRYKNGAYVLIGAFVYWWSFSEARGGTAWFRGLGCGYTTVIRDYDGLRNGLSVRCVRD